MDFRLPLRGYWLAGHVAHFWQEVYQEVVRNDKLQIFQRKWVGIVAFSVIQILELPVQQHFKLSNNIEIENTDNFSFSKLTILKLD